MGQSVNHEIQFWQAVSRTMIKILIPVAIIFSVNETANAAISVQEITSELSLPLMPEHHTEMLQHPSNMTASNKLHTLSLNIDLWDNLIQNCYNQPSTSCFQQSVFSYLSNNINAHAINVSNKLSFSKNPATISNLPTAMTNEKKQVGNETQFTKFSAGSVEQILSFLYKRTVDYIINHDMNVKMPGRFFDDATLRIAPVHLENNELTIKLQLLENDNIEPRQSGRIFKKKIQKFFKNKLLLSLLAVILVVKLIKIKLFWLLPLILGVSTAKKILLKFLLFLFPGLSHLFKLCGSYQENYHGTKFHQHHHLINHHHTVTPTWYDHKDHHASSVFLPNGPELIFTDPPKGNPANYIHGPQLKAPFPINKPVKIHNVPHYPVGWENSGPGLGPEYIGDINRNAQVDSEEKIRLQLIQSKTPSSHSFIQSQLSANQFGNVISKTKKFGPENDFPFTPNTVSNEIRIQKLNEPIQNQESNMELTQAHLKEILRMQTEQKLIEQQQNILQKEPFLYDSEEFDAFYSPILSKVDRILESYGTTDNYCKEQLVCSMYKTPLKYSPHSNYISTELSRDLNELQKPTAKNGVVRRFYRLIQAARDGQNQRNCLEYYSQCSADIK